MESILTSIKKLLGIEEDYTHFDPDITMLINSALNSMHQLGIGWANGFQISDKTTKWSDLTDDERQIGMAKEYVYIKTRLVFDPPSNSFVVDALTKQLSEIEWRLNVSAETSM